MYTLSELPANQQHMIEITTLGTNTPGFQLPVRGGRHYFVVTVEIDGSSVALDKGIGYLDISGKIFSRFYIESLTYTKA